MSFFTGSVLFVLIWWMVLFTVLPFGVSGQNQTGTGAPESPRLRRKFLITTLLSVLVWLALYALIRYAPIDFRDMARTMNETDNHEP